MNLGIKAATLSPQNEIDGGLQYSVDITMSTIGFQIGFQHEVITKHNCPKWSFPEPVLMLSLDVFFFTPRYQSWAQAMVALFLAAASTVDVSGLLGPSEPMMDIEG